MDNSPEGHKKPDDSADTLYSSKDILGKSIAGTDKDFFVKTKKARVSGPELRKRFGDRLSTIKNKLVHNKLTHFMATNKIITAIIFAGILVIISVVIMLIMAIVKQHRIENLEDSVADFSEESAGEDSEGDTYLKEDTDDASEDTTEYREPWEGLPEDVVNEFKGRIDNAASADEYLDARLDFAKAIAEYGKYEESLNEIEDLDLDAFSDCQLFRYYDALVSIGEIAGQTEDAESYRAERKNYEGACNV